MLLTTLLAPGGVALGDLEQSRRVAPIDAEVQVEASNCLAAHFHKTACRDRGKELRHLERHCGETAIYTYQYHAPLMNFYAASGREALCRLFSYKTSASLKSSLGHPRAGAHNLTKRRLELPGDFNSEKRKQI